jgi:recombination protein RecR
MSSSQAYPDSVAQLIEQFMRMPGVGKRSAERLVFHILRMSVAEANALADAVRSAKHNVQHCSRCHRFAQADPCAVCTDQRRDTTRICVVEEPRDAAVIEQSGAYRGLYHVLCGHWAPLEGMEPEHLTIGHLVERVEAEDIEEVILATNPDTEGEATAMYVRQALAEASVRVTRLARGMPSGSHLEYANPDILTDALDGRRDMD